MKWLPAALMVTGCASYHGPQACLLAAEALHYELGGEVIVIRLKRSLAPRTHAVLRVGDTVHDNGFLNGRSEFPAEKLAQYGSVVHDNWSLPGASNLDEVARRVDYRSGKLGAAGLEQLSRVLRARLR